MGGNSGRYETLDLVRGVAAILVVLLHWRFVISPAYCAPNAGLAVDIFFVLSGFVIAHSFDSRLRLGLGASSFLRSRVWRLQPLIIVGLIIGTAMMLVQSLMGARPDLSAMNVMLSMMFNLLNLPYKIGRSIYGFTANEAQWSLFYEFLVNIAFVVFWPLLRQRILLSIICVSLLSLLVVSFITGSAMGGSHFWDFPAGASRSFYGFFLGVFLARTRLRWSPAMPDLSPYGVAVFVLIVLGLPTLGRVELPYDLLVQVFVSPLIIMVGSVCRPRTQHGASICRFMGLISFPLYATHMPLRDWAIGVISKLHLPSIYAPAVMIPFSVVFAYILARFFEPWCVRMRRRLDAERPNSSALLPQD